MAFETVIWVFSTDSAKSALWRRRALLRVMPSGTAVGVSVLATSARSLRPQEATGQLLNRFFPGALKGSKICCEEKSDIEIQARFHHGSYVAGRVHGLAAADRPRP